MKNLGSLLFLYYFVFNVGFTQEISLSVDTLERGEGKEKYSYQSIDQYDQKLLIKLGTFDASGDLLDAGGYDVPFDLIAVEKKMTNTLSVEGTYYFPAREIHVFSLRLRHYLNRKGLANNLSGHYFSVEYSKIVNESFLGSDPYFGEDQTLFLQFGNQIKRSRFGYADFRLYTSYRFASNNPTSFSENWFNLGFNVMLGAAWGPTGRRSALSSTAPLVNHHEQTLLTIENASLVVSETFDAFSFSTSIEQEIFIKGLTSRTQLSFGYSRQVAPDFLLENIGFSVSEEIRKYFGLLKKPAVDRPVHSFSGIYTGGGANNTFTLRKVNYNVDDLFSEDPSFSGSDRIVPFLSLGYQERLGRRFFFDLFARYFFYTRTDFFDNQRGDGRLSFGSRVGINWGW